jgi:aspartate aminotransferase
LGYGGIPKIIPTDEEFLPKLDKLEDALGPKTKAVIINSPNNPSGAVIPEDRLADLGALLGKKEKEYGTAIFLISDQVYRRIMFDGLAYPRIWKHHDNSIAVTSHSKDLALAGERIGYAAINPASAYREQLSSFMDNCQRSCGYVSAPALMQRIVAKLQDVTIDLDTYQRQRDFVCDNLLEMGYSLKKPKGGLCIYPKSPIEDDITFVTDLREEHKVLAVGGTVFGTPGYFRISFATEDKDLEGSMKGFKAMADKYALKG